jgi:4-hydroxyphenylacetate 3-monooxygenase
MAVTRPLTGEEYLESLRDGREVWLYGERVTDVTTHPAFRNAARMVARLYDALHDPKFKEVLTTATDTGSEGYTHRYFRAPTTWEEQLAARRGCRLGPSHVRLAGACARLQRGLSRYLGSQRRVL